MQVQLQGQGREAKEAMEGEKRERGREKVNERTSSEGKGLFDPNGQVGLACLQLS